MVAETTAEGIACALDGRQVSANNWMARCPAHDDRSPSFSIADKGGRVLFHCFAGCSQHEVIDALTSRGLWHKPKEKAEVYTLLDREEMAAFCRAYESGLRRGIQATSSHSSMYRQYMRVLCSPFTPGELVEMHLFCLGYSADVKNGLTPGKEADDLFLQYSQIVREKGVPRYGW